MYLVDVLLSARLREGAVSNDSHSSLSSAHRERLTIRRLASLVVGFGIVMLVWPEIRLGESGRGFLAGVVSTQVACVGWAVGSTYTRDRDRLRAT